MRDCELVEACMEETKNAYKMLVGKSERKVLFCRPRRRWGDNIIMDLKEMVWEDVDQIHLAYDWDQWRALQSTMVNFQIT